MGYHVREVIAATAAELPMQASDSKPRVLGLGTSRLCFPRIPLRNLDHTVEQPRLRKEVFGIRRIDVPR
jgi:hypothetical protein